MKAVAVYLKYIEIERTVCEVFSGDHAMSVVMCLLLECWKSQPFLEKNSNNQIFFNGDVLLN